MGFLNRARLLLEPFGRNLILGLMHAGPVLGGFYLPQIYEKSGEYSGHDAVCLSDSERLDWDRLRRAAGA